jgi:hypothetical protein
MNERINKLAKQAVFESYKAGCIDQKEIVLEKFAELIVRECIEQCSKALVEYTGQPSVTHNYAVGLCQDSIKEHFYGDQ